MLIPDLDFRVQSNITIKDTPEGVACTSDGLLFESYDPAAEHLFSALDENTLYQILADACGDKPDGHYEVSCTCRMSFTIDEGRGAIGACKVIHKEIKSLLQVVH